MVRGGEKAAWLSVASTMPRHTHSTDAIVTHCRTEGATRSTRACVVNACSTHAQGVSRARVSRARVSRRRCRGSTEAGAEGQREGGCRGEEGGRCVTSGFSSPAMSAKMRTRPGMAPRITVWKETDSRVSPAFEAPMSWLGLG